MKTLKIILLSLVLFGCFSYQASAVTCRSSATLTGPSSTCVGNTDTYTGTVSCSAFTEFSVVGGTITGANFPIDPGGTSITISGIFDGTITATVNWTSAGTKRVRLFTRSGTSHTDVATIRVTSPGEAQMIGSEGVICEFITEEAYSMINATPVTGAQWSVTPTGVGATLSPSSGSVSTVLGNMIPGVTYRVEFTGTSTLCGSTITDAIYVSTTGTAPDCGPIPFQRPDHKGDLTHGEEATVATTETESASPLSNPQLVQSTSSSAVTQLFPNPAVKGQDIHLQLPAQTEPYRLELYNLEGKLMHERQSADPTTVLSTNELTSGIYFLKVITDTDIQTHRLLIN